MSGCLTFYIVHVPKVTYLGMYEINSGGFFLVFLLSKMMSQLQFEHRMYSAQWSFSESWIICLGSSSWINRKELPFLRKKISFHSKNNLLISINYRLLLNNTMNTIQHNNTLQFSQKTLKFYQIVLCYCVVLCCWFFSFFF